MPVQRGEIYFADLNPASGREQAGTRPVLVISSDQVNTRPLVVTVVVGTHGDRVPREYPTNARIAPDDSGLPHETVFLCFQLRSLDARRLVQPRAGLLEGEAMAKVETAVRYCLDL